MDSSFSDTSHAVEVVPMFAPSRMRKLELKEIVPASTNATARGDRAARLNDCRRNDAENNAIAFC
jgi:hypothetical protein